MANIKYEEVKINELNFVSKNGSTDIIRYESCVLFVHIGKLKSKDAVSIYHMSKVLVMVLKAQ